MNPRPRLRRASRGFTLIEVLLTSVLAATLLAALWALLSMYLKLFDAGQVKVEQAQLVRTLFAQLESDLASVVQSPPAMPVVPVLISPAAAPASSSPTSPKSPAGSAPSPGSSAASSAAPQGSPAQNPASMGAGSAPSAIPAALRQPRGPRPDGPRPEGLRGPASPGSSPSSTKSPAAGPSRARHEAAQVTATASLRPSGVFGTESSLQIDVLQAAIVPAEIEIEQHRMPGEVGPTHAPELTTIVYSFEENQEPGQPVGQPTMRLVRRELAWEDRHPAIRAARGTAQLPGQSTAHAPVADGLSTSRNQTGPPLPVDPLPPPIEDDKTTIVPEVAQFGVRYYDGAAWVLEWNSAERHALPVAIEITLEMRPAHEGVAPPPPPELAAVDATARVPVGPVHRLLVHLEGSAPATPESVMPEFERPHPRPLSDRDAPPPVKTRSDAKRS